MNGMPDIEPEDYDRLQEPVLAEIVALCEEARDHQRNDPNRWSQDELDRKRRMIGRAVQALNELLEASSG